MITGEFLMQIRGDWTKGEWLAAGKVPGEDFGCIEIPGAEAVVVTVDSWGVLGGQAFEMDAAQLNFARVALDPAVQAEFAAAKGSTPTRLDAQGEVEVRSHDVLFVLGDAERQVFNPLSTVDADWQSSMWDVLFYHRSDPARAPDKAIAELQDTFDTILGWDAPSRARELRSRGTLPSPSRGPMVTPKEASTDARLLDEDAVVQICFVTRDAQKSAHSFSELTAKPMPSNAGPPTPTRPRPSTAASPHASAAQLACSPSATSMSSSSS